MTGGNKSEVKSLSPSLVAHYYTAGVGDTAPNHRRSGDEETELKDVDRSQRINHPCETLKQLANSAHPNYLITWQIQSE